MATLYGRTAAVKTLLRHQEVDVNIVAQEDASQTTALAFAAGAVQADVVAALLERPEIDTELKDRAELSLTAKLLAALPDSTIGCRETFCGD